MPRLRSGALHDRPETSKRPPTPKVIWQQHRNTHLVISHKSPNNNLKRKKDMV